MATIVPDNPFDTQPPKATNTNPTSAGIVASALPEPGKAMTYTPETRAVNQQTETVQGQMNSILSQDSPLMQRARTMAAQQMAQRGLVNSSMAVGAAQSAMIDKAMPIAQQDASTYNAVASENTNARNRAADLNTSQLNQFALQKGAQDFQAGQQQTQNDFNARMQQLQESGQDSRQARDIASREAMIRLEQLGVQNRFDQELALKSSQFNIEQYNLERRQLLENQNELDKMGLQINANNAQIPTNFAANISNTAMSGVNAVMADGNLSADAKRAAIDNIVNYANSQIAWAEKFYNTGIPRITTPSTSTTSTSTSPSPAPASAPAPVPAPAPTSSKLPGEDDWLTRLRLSETSS